MSARFITALALAAALAPAAAQTVEVPAEGKGLEYVVYTYKLDVYDAPASSDVTASLDAGAHVTGLETAEDEHGDAVRRLGRPMARK
jgi:hypothetical protein